MLKHINLLRKLPQINNQHNFSIKHFTFKINKVYSKSILMQVTFCFSTGKLFKGNIPNQPIKSSTLIQQVEPKVNETRSETIKQIPQNLIIPPKQKGKNILGQDSMVAKDHNNLNKKKRNQRNSIRTGTMGESSEIKDSIHSQNKNFREQKETQSFYKKITDDIVQNESSSLIKLLQNLTHKYPKEFKNKKFKQNNKQEIRKENESNNKSLSLFQQNKQVYTQHQNVNGSSTKAFENLNSVKKLEQKVQKIENSQVKLVKTLSSVLSQVNQQMEFPDQKYFEQNFFYILDPHNLKEPLVSFGFRYFLFKFTKYHMYFSQTLSPQDSAAMELKAKQTVNYYCLNDQGDTKSIFNKFKLPEDQIYYMEHFLTNLLGYDSKFLYDIFLQIGFSYFNLLKQKLKLSETQLNTRPYIPSKNVLQIIQTNIYRLIVAFQQDTEMESLHSEDYSRERQFFNLFLDFYCMRKHQFETSDKIICTNITKFLKIPHPEFLQFIKETIQTDQQNYSTVEFLSMLGYLVQSKNTPYEYFYKNKGAWMKIIESAHDFSEKKTKCCVKFLQILSRQRFVHCQTIYSSLLQSIENNLEAMEGKQLVRVLYFYSKSKYGMSPKFVSNLVDKISRWLPLLEQTHFSLLVRSIGNLNYQSEQLIQKLKNINYERFLAELKYGCENLGSYYQEILKEVQEQSRGRDYYDGQELIFSSEVNADDMKLVQKVA